ncbi:hypothetical protein ACSSNL_03240 [Thalassobius sp. S69A]|uniref:hypothetical protein n=1 Tax=unclassified Thalassovita TaxID=2619711 RepID=UPI003C7D8528
MKTGLLACLAALGMAGAATAEIYECKMKSRGNYGGISDVLFYSYDSTKPKEIWVHDGLTETLAGGAVWAKLVRDDEKFLKLKWSIPPTRTKEYGSTPRYDYTLSIHKKKGLTAKKGLAVVYGRPIGYDNHFEGHGACKPYKKK